MTPIKSLYGCYSNKIEYILPIMADNNLWLKVSCIYPRNCNSCMFCLIVCSDLSVVYQACAEHCERAVM